MDADRILEALSAFRYSHQYFKGGADHISLAVQYEELQENLPQEAEYVPEITRQLMGALTHKTGTPKNKLSFQKIYCFSKPRSRAESLDVSKIHFSPALNTNAKVTEAFVHHVLRKSEQRGFD